MRKISWPEVFYKMLENIPLIFFFVGILMMVLAANHGYSKVGIIINNSVWIWIIGGSGFGLVIISILFYAYEFLNRSRPK
jgi:hypothetical protein